jgi:hypothetical protein
MIERTITESEKMRIIETSCRIFLGERFGQQMWHESSRVSYIPLNHADGLTNYFADFDRESQSWVLTDSFNKRLGTFPNKSTMTRWVRKRIALQ